MTSSQQEPREKRSYSPRPGPWVAGLASGAVLGALFALLYPPLAIGMVIVGLAIGAAFAFALQAAADDLARRRR